MGDKKMSRAEALAFCQEAEAALKPCKFCGRVMLAGVCCQAALDEVKDEQEAARRAKDRAVTMRLRGRPK